MTPMTEDNRTARNPETAGPKHAFDDEASDFRTYVHPRTGERFTSVTTALGIVEKSALNPWYAKLATLHLLGSLADVNDAARAGRVSCQRSGCGRCLMCLIALARKAPERERDAAADRGRRFHHVAEWYALNGTIIGHDDDIAQHVKQFAEFVRVHQVKFQASEVTVLNRADGWGGTLDGILTCGWMPPKHKDLIGIPLMFDYKTSNGIYATAGLQLGAYNHHETVLMDDGSEQPALIAHPDVALSIQVRADGWWVRPCPTTDATYEKFRRVLGVWRDLNEPDEPLVGRAMYKPRARAGAGA